MTIYDLAWTEPAYQSDTLKSYLYVQYNDDDDLQAFVEAYNALSQEIITWLAEANLPVYTGAPITGALLDWVAMGLYGQSRPTLPSGFNRNRGPFNSLEFNTLPFNGLETVFQDYVPLEFAPVFKAAVDGGALQLPFQFTWIVTV